MESLHSFNGEFNNRHEVDVGEIDFLFPLSLSLSLSLSFFLFSFPFFFLYFSALAPFKNKRGIGERMKSNVVRLDSKDG